MNLNELSIKLQNRLKLDLPGEEAQIRMGIMSKKLYNSPNTENQAIPAAVLILLHENKSNICFSLTERTETVEHHRGQISLPGGAQEKEEKLSMTALRETEEEIGVMADNVLILGALTPLFVIITGFMIYPFIGISHTPLDVIPAPNEVASVFSVPINDLINDNNMKTEHKNIRGYNVDVPYFNFSGYKVWGATSMILSEFKTILKDIINE